MRNNNSEIHNSRCVKVIIDTNALMMPFQKNVDIETQLIEIYGKYEIIILSTVIDELKNLTDKGNWQAKSALELAKRYKLLETDGKGDNAIISAAKRINATVITNDKKLRKELRQFVINVIVFRDNRLWIDGFKGF